LNTTPTALNSLRNRPPQAGQSVNASSVKLWWISKASPQSWHWY